MDQLTGIRINGRDKFHPIVGRVRHTTLQDQLMLTAPKDARPASGTGVPEARSVRYRDMVHYLGMLLKKLKLVG